MRIQAVYDHASLVVKGVPRDGAALRVHQQLVEVVLPLQTDEATGSFYIELGGDPYLLHNVRDESMGIRELSPVDLQRLNGSGTVVSLLQVNANLMTLAWETHFPALYFTFGKHEGTSSGNLDAALKRQIIHPELPQVDTWDSYMQSNSY
jgi:hypothetical protein